MNKLSNSEDIPQIGSGTIIDHSSGKQFEFSVFHGCCLQRAVTCNVEWGKAFSIIITDIYNRVESLEERIKLMGEYLIQDAHWNWIAKAVQLSGDEYEWFFCDIEGIPQGVCIIFHPKESYLQNGNVFYIEYVSTAPWNRRIPKFTKRFDEIGKILISHAVDVAVNKLKLIPGFNLHSLPQSNKYYERLGMVLIKGHEKNGMSFFEMPKALAIEIQNAK